MNSDQNSLINIIVALLQQNFKKSYYGTHFNYNQKYLKSTNNNNLMNNSD